MALDFTKVGLTDISSPAQPASAPKAPGKARTRASSATLPAGLRQRLPYPSGTPEAPGKARTRASSATLPAGLRQRLPYPSGTPGEPPLVALGRKSPAKRGPAAGAPQSRGPSPFAQRPLGPNLTQLGQGWPPGRPAQSPPGPALATSGLFPFPRMHPF